MTNALPTNYNKLTFKQCLDKSKQQHGGKKSKIKKIKDKPKKKNKKK